MKTYTTLSRNVGRLWSEARSLYRIRAGNIAGDVRQTVALMEHVERRVGALGGRPFRDLDVLVVGSGQTLREVTFLSLRNRVVGIDLDVVPQGLQPFAYLKLARTNGIARAAKTMVRKALLIDLRYASAMRRQLGVARLPRATLLEMDAARMTFREAMFDLVYSFSVFEHLSEPAASLAECVRVLRPGGALHISLHLYSAEGGCHDLRIFSGERDMIPYWAQLRPAHAHAVQESAYMNKLSLAEWRRIFQEQLPGCTVDTEPHHATFDATLREELARLRNNGELADYTDEDVLSVNVVVTWRKP